MNTAQDTGRVYALLADGTTVEIREACYDDFDAVQAMHEAMAPDNIYLRFFSYSRRSAETEARRICADPAPGNAALLALRDGELVGVASYAGLTAHPGQAEVAFAVADHMHHKGIATLLLEHLVSLARSQQITTFTAETLTENRAILKVFADAGLPVQRHFGGDVYELTLPLPRDEDGTALDTYLSAVAERETSADVASLRHLLAPESVVVVGASRRREAIGRVILENIRGGGYAGRLYTVNPRARQIDGDRCLASVLDLPEPADLAVIAVPAPAVLGVAEQCGQRGVRSLVVITSGLDAAACADLLAVCRRNGVRLVGPNCFGVAVPGLGLDATFAATRPRPGVAGLMSQSGGVGIALAGQLSRLGVGISSFASVGSKLDVSGNDMLMWWEHDDVTRLAVLYLESFGNPRKFARTARRVGAKMPVLTVRAAGNGQSSATDQALFEQAGVIATGSFGELTETAALLATQPVPAGRTVAIVSNAGGAGLLAAGACTELGLTVHQPHGLTRRRLRTLLPGGAVTGPVDTTAAVSAEDFRRSLELLAADEGVDAMIALVLPTGATGDLITAIQDADVGVPLAAVALDQAETVRLMPRPASSGADGQIPVYDVPEAAAAALAHAARYGAWRTEPHGQVPSFPDVRAADARALVTGFLHREPGGGWLPPDKTAGLLHCHAPAAIDLNQPGSYLTWNVFTISVANLVLIAVMVAIFGAALLLPFPRGRGEDAAVPDPAPDAGIAPGDERMWTARARRRALTSLPPHKLLPDRQPAYVASWVYVFGVASLAALGIVIVSGFAIALGGPDWWHTNPVGHFFNSLHLWSVELFMALLVIHLWGKFWMAAWRGRRTLTWITGVVAFLASVVECFTGYLSQQNFDSQWISTNGKDAFNEVGIGAFFNLMNFGQMLMWHIVLLPIILIAIVGAHMLLVRMRGVSHPLPVARPRGLAARRAAAKADRAAWRGPTRRYDILKEGTIATVVILVLTVGLATLLSSPNVPPATVRSWVQVVPADFLATAATELDGTSLTATYGPPYNSNGTPQSEWFAPANWAGVRQPIDAAQTFVLGPLSSAAPTDPTLAAALATYRAASPDQQAKWAANYGKAVQKVTFVNGAPVVPAADDGPVPVMLASELALARSGGIDAALSGAQPFYGTDFTKPLLFLEDGAYYADKATAEHLTGDQWGVMNETGSYPGQPWLWLYQLWYHLPGWRNSANIDLIAIYMTGLATLLLLAIPFIPGLRDIPRWIPVHRLVWRDWNRRSPGPVDQPGTQPEPAGQK